MPPTAAAKSWIQRSFDLHGRRVGVLVRRLPDDERRRVAAQIAWFADGIIDGADPSAMHWPAFLQDILANDVAITLDEEGTDTISGFWDHMLYRILQTFLSANQLDPAVRFSLRDHATSREL
jgi:hypothetical protein